MVTKADTKKFLIRLIKHILEYIFPALWLSLVLLGFVFVLCVFFYVAFLILPEILNVTISALPINNNNVYPILLQGLLIVASMIFGFYGILLFYSIKRFNKFMNKHKSKDLFSKILKPATFF